MKVFRSKIYFSLLFSAVALGQVGEKSSAIACGTFLRYADGTGIQRVYPNVGLELLKASGFSKAQELARELALIANLNGAFIIEGHEKIQRFLEGWTRLHDIRYRKWARSWEDAHLKPSEIDQTTEYKAFVTHMNTRAMAVYYLLGAITTTALYQSDHSQAGTIALFLTAFGYPVLKKAVGKMVSTTEFAIDASDDPIETPQGARGIITPKSIPRMLLVNHVNCGNFSEDMLFTLAGPWNGEISQVKRLVGYVVYLRAQGTTPARLIFLSKEEALYPNGVPAFSLSE